MIALPADIVGPDRLLRLAFKFKRKGAPEAGGEPLGARLLRFNLE
jgi:hypothetical protein